MDDLKARAALKLGVSPDDLYNVALRDDGIWPAEIVVLYNDYRKVKFLAAELPELPEAPKAADKPVSTRGRKN